MGYSSMIYFCREVPTLVGTHGEIVARIDMENLGDSWATTQFLNCFDTDTGFSIYVLKADADGEESMTDTLADGYGMRLQYASNMDMLYAYALQMMEQELEDNRYPFEMLAEMIRVFRNCPGARIVHYGY